MTNADAALLKLATWLSPAFPVGAFSYSHGLEWAVAAGDVVDPASLEAYARIALTQGAGRSDAILLAHASRAAARADQGALDDVAVLAAALHPSAERRRESLAQGRAFERAAAAAWPPPPPHPAAAPIPADALAYPVAVGWRAGAHGCPPSPTLALFLAGFAANLVAAGVKLIPIGQTDGQRILAALHPILLAVADEAEAAPLDAVGGAAFRIDLASMAHETQETRLFRS